jgi:hypothetical protein
MTFAATAVKVFSIQPVFRRLSASVAGDGMVVIYLQSLVRFLFHVS